MTYTLPAYEKGRLQHKYVQLAKPYHNAINEATRILSDMWCDGDLQQSERSETAYDKFAKQLAQMASEEIKDRIYRRRTRRQRRKLGRPRYQREIPEALLLGIAYTLAPYRPATVERRDRLPVFVRQAWHEELDNLVEHITKIETYHTTSGERIWGNPILLEIHLASTSTFRKYALDAFQDYFHQVASQMLDTWRPPDFKAVPLLSSQILARTSPSGQGTDSSMLV